MKPIKVGIAGLGAIGRAITRKLRAGAVPDVELCGVCARDHDKAQAVLNEIGCAAPVMAIDALAKASDLVLECAPAAVFAEIAVPVLSAGKMFMALSVGQLLERPELIVLAKEHGGQIIVPTGALIGLDAVTAAAEGEIHSVSMITRNR
jgi:aspartate dehydrogenase